LEKSKEPNRALDTNNGLLASEFWSVAKLDIVEPIATAEVSYPSYYPRVVVHMAAHIFQRNFDDGF
jgi:hypothetical protein